jgi:hypothetical protein
VGFVLAEHGTKEATQTRRCRTVVCIKICQGKELGKKECDQFRIISIIFQRNDFKNKEED